MTANSGEMTTQLVPYSRGSRARVFSKAEVTNEDRFSPDAAQAMFLAFAQNAGASDDDAREYLQGLVAIACAKGTSYQRNLSRVHINFSVSTSSTRVTLADLVSVLPRDTDNDLRVWARSMPGFADLTYDLIAANSWLRTEQARLYNAALDVAPVCFDYADAITYDLTPNEKSVVAMNTARKVTGSRAMFAENDSSAELPKFETARAIDTSLKSGQGRRPQGNRDPTDRYGN